MFLFQRTRSHKSGSIALDTDGGFELCRAHAVLAVCGLSIVLPQAGVRHAVSRVITQVSRVITRAEACGTAIQHEVNTSLGIPATERGWLRKSIGDVEFSATSTTLRHLPS